MNDGVTGDNNPGVNIIRSFCEEQLYGYTTNGNADTEGYQKFVPLFHGYEIRKLW
jgi:hypothetical protein